MPVAPAAGPYLTYTLPATVTPEQADRLDAMLASVLDNALALIAPENRIPNPAGNAAETPGQARTAPETPPEQEIPVPSPQKPVPAISPDDDTCVAPGCDAVVPRLFGGAYCNDHVPPR